MFWRYSIFTGEAQASQNASQASSSCTPRARDTYSVSLILCNKVLKSRNGSYGFFYSRYLNKCFTPISAGIEKKIIFSGLNIITNEKIINSWFTSSFYGLSFFCPNKAPQAQASQTS